VVKRNPFLSIRYMEKKLSFARICAPHVALTPPSGSETVADSQCRRDTFALTALSFPQTHKRRIHPRIGKRGEEMYTLHDVGALDVL
jgi:hypothetical protein